MMERRTNQNYLNDSNDIGENGIVGSIKGSQNLTVSSLEARPCAEKQEDIGWLYKCLLLLLVLACFLIFVVVVSRKKRQEKAVKQKVNQEEFPDSPSPIEILTAEVKDITEAGHECSQVVYFVEEHEQVKIEELLGSAAELQGQSFTSSLYKVTLENNDIYAIKRLKKFQASMEAFGKTMRWVGSLRHPNLLPLVAYHSTSDEKLLIYRYQRKRSLLYLLESHAEGKREFPWSHRLLIASGIARGLDYIYRKSTDEHIPHGNLKLSNILLNENEEPLISEYGFQRYIDPKLTVLFSANGYKAPEKSLTEKSDVFSFGVILLELLTGKTIERTGLDLPKWVRSMVREEWTGEVFDKEVNEAGKQWAFPLLNVSLQCVSHMPENRPSIAAVLEKIEEVVNANEDYSFPSTNPQEDYSFSSASSIQSMQDGCLLHTVIPEAWGTPGSNH